VKPRARPRLGCPTGEWFAVREPLPTRSFSHRSCVLTVAGAPQACRRWKRVADNHPKWPQLLKEHGLVSIEARKLTLILPQLTVCSRQAAFVEGSEAKGGLIDGACGGPQWHRGGDAVPEVELSTLRTSSGDEWEEPLEWENVGSPGQMTELTNHDAKLLLLAMQQQQRAAKEEEDGYGGGSLWDTVAILPGSRAERLPPSLATLSAVYAGKVMLKITMAGGVVLAAASCVSMALPWWQRPMARWLMRGYAMDLCWLTTASTGMYGASEASSSEEPGATATTTVAASVVGGGCAGYLGTLAFVTLM
jgi:hypothetical protein